MASLMESAQQTLKDPMKQVQGTMAGATPAANTNTVTTATAVPQIVKPQPVAPPPAAPTFGIRDITENETVSGQLNKLLAGDSLYMQAAKNNALTQANARGLMNSSLAVESAQKAAIESALPIAQADASTYAQSGLSGQQATQEAGLKEQGFGYDSNLKEQGFGYDSALNTQNIAANVNLQSLKDAAAMEQLLKQIAGQKDVAAMNNAADLKAARLQAETQRSIASMNNSASMARLQAEAESDLALQNARYGSEAELLEAKNAAELELQTTLQAEKYAQELQYQKDLKDAGLNIDLQKLASAEKETFTNVLQQYQTQVGNIQRIPDEQMSPADKAKAIEEQTKYIQIAADIYGPEITGDIEWPVPVGSTDPLEQVAADRGFNEADYLAANPDVVALISKGKYNSAMDHFLQVGMKQGRTKENGWQKGGGGGVSIQPIFPPNDPGGDFVTG